MLRQRSILAALAAFALSAAAFAADPPKAPVPDPVKPSLGGDKVAPFVHTVIIRLKKDAPAGTADMIAADCHALLESIPSVRGIKAGRPAPVDETTEKNVARDYDVGLVVFFDDAAGLKAYLVHEQHLKFVNTYKQYFDNVQVFDFIDAPAKK